MGVVVGESECGVRVVLDDGGEEWREGREINGGGGGQVIAGTYSTLLYTYTYTYTYSRSSIITTTKMIETR